ncbi:hypothetical protein BaRGS_00039531, partial [Batillaria attramentaria]
MVPVASDRSFRHSDNSLILSFPASVLEEREREDESSFLIRRQVWVCRRTLEVTNQTLASEQELCARD